MVGIRLFDINKNTVGVLELDGQTDTTFEENSALFSDGIPSGFSAPGTIPNTPHNNAILQNAHILKRLEYIMVYKCEVVRDNVPVYQGDFLLLEATNTTIQYSIAINGFNTSVFDKKLKDYDWPVTTITDPDDDTIDIVNYCSDKCKTIDWREAFTFPVYYNPELYGEGSTSKNGHFSNIVNEWDDTDQKLKYNFTGTDPMDVSSSYNRYALVPWFYIKWLLKTIAEMEGYTIGGTALNAAEFEKLILPNNYTLDKKSGIDMYVKKYVSNQVYSIQEDVTIIDPPSSTDLAFAGSVIEFVGGTDTYGVFNNATHKYSTTLPDRYSISFSLTINIPTPELGANLGIFIYLVDALDTVVHLYSETGLQADDFNPLPITFDEIFEIDSYSYSSYKLKILVQSDDNWSDGDIEVSGNVEFRAVYYPNLNVYTNVIDPKNHVPDITVGDLILMLRDIYCLNIDFDRTLRKLMVTFAEADLKSQPLEVTPGNNPHLSSGLTVPEEYIFRYIDSTQYKYLWDFGQDKTAEGFLTVDRDKVIGTSILEADLDTDFPNAQLGDIAYVEHLQRYYIRKYDPVFSSILWFFHSYAYQEYQTGIKPTDKAPICSPMVTVVQRVPGESYSRMITQIVEQGTSLAFDTGENEPSVKICYWHGRQYNNTGYLYPMATSGSRDYTTGALITTHYDGTGPGQYAPVVIMEWEYLFNAFWLSFYQLMQAPHEVEMQALATLGFLRGLNLSKPITINYITYVLKTLRYPLLNSGHIPTTLIMARKTPAL